MIEANRSFSKKNEPGFIGVLDERFVIEATNYFKKNERSWKGFRKSSLKMLSEVKNLLKKKAAPIIMGQEDEIENPIATYGNIVNETEEYLENNNKVNEEIVSSIITIAVPFIGIQEGIELSDFIKDNFPSQIIKQFKKKLKTKAFIEALPVYGDQMNKSAITGIFLSSIILFITNNVKSIAALDRFPTLNNILSAVPFITAPIYYFGMGTRKGVKKYKEIIDHPPTDFIKDNMIVDVDDKGGITDELLVDPTARDSRVNDLENTVYESHKDGIGTTLYKLINKKPNSKDIYLDKIWGVENDKIFQWNEPLIARKLTQESLLKLKKLKDKLINYNLTASYSDMERGHSLRDEYEIEYKNELEELLILLDQSEYVHEALGEKSPFILQVMWKRLMDIKTTRRQFVLGTAIGATVLTFASLTSNLFSNSEKKVKKLFSRPKIEALESFNRADQKQVLKIFSNTLKRYWPENSELDKNSALQLLSTDDYSNRIQSQAVLYFSANTHIKNKSVEEKQILYEKYLAEEYFPWMVHFARGLKLRLVTLIAGVVLSADNVGNISIQNQDVDISEVQNIMGGLGWYLHRNWGIPFNELSKTALYGLLEPYNANRITGNATIGFNDMELKKITEGYFLLPKEDQQRISKQFPKIPLTINLLKEDSEYEKNLKLILKKQVVDYIFSSKTDNESPLFKIIKENSGWDLIGLGDNYDAFDITFQTTRFSRVWANISRNYFNNIAPEKIIELSFKQTRQELIEIYNDKFEGGLEKAVEALIADQIENPKFRNWWASVIDSQSNKRNNIIKTFDDLEATGNDIRNHSINAYNVVSEKEYHTEFQLGQGIGTLKALVNQVKRSDYMKRLCELDPLWEAFLTICIREVSPIKLLAEETLYPINVDYDDPYNPGDVLAVIETLAKFVDLAYHPNNAHDLLNITLSILDYGKDNDNPPGHFLDTVGVWNLILNEIHKLDLKFWSGTIKALEIMKTIEKSHEISIPLEY